METGCLRLTTNADRPRLLKRRKVLQAPKNDADSGLADCVWEQISRQRVQEPRRPQQTVDLGTHICSELNGSCLHFPNGAGRPSTMEIRSSKS